MKKFLKGFLALFVVATLFSYSMVLGAAEEELNKVLETITEGAQIQGMVLTDSEGMEMTKEDFIYKIEDKNFGNSYYDEETGCIKIDGENYKLAITDSSNGTICEPATVECNDGNYYIRVLSKPAGEGSYTFSLINESGETSASISKENYTISSDKKLKIKLRQEESGGLRGIVFSTIKRLVSELICAITIPVGDSFLHMISSALGENVTIDRVVFDDISKTNVDFFDLSTGEAATNQPIKNILANTVNKWYGTFRDLVLVFYMALLVYMGIKILLTSTANKKAIYKRIMTAWVMGVVMLIFFPYVMKYSIKLNHAFCKTLQGLDGNATTEPSTTAAMTSFRNARSLYGNDGFIMLMLGKNEISENSKKDFANTAVSSGAFNGETMMYIRFVADHTTNVPLAVVYLILIGETFALLVMYYKRVFMIAFLITIFPIVAACYPLSKTGDIRMNTFSVWFKEFFVNVFVQSFHAATYVVVVSVGISSYITNVANGNWLFMIICILFLFEGEKIIRGIFDAKSSINSIGDIAASGMLAMNVARNITKFMPQLPNRKKDQDGNANEKAASDRPAPQAPGANTPGAQANANAVNALSNGANAQNNGVALGRQQGATVSSANASLDSNMGKAKGKSVWANRIAGAVGGGASVFAQAVGTANGFAMGMAQNDGRGPSGLEKGISSAIHGKTQGQLIGQGTSSLITGAVGRVTAMKAGRALAQEYSAGEHDDEIFTDADKQMDEVKKEALRQAYAKAARDKGRGRDNKAEVRIIKERINQTKS